MSHRISALQQVTTAFQQNYAQKKIKNKTQQKHVKGYSNILTIALQVF